MDRCKLSDLFCLQVQYACIIAVVLLVGCAAPRSQVLGGTASTPLPKVNDQVSEQSAVQLDSAQQLQSVRPEVLPDPQFSDRADQNSLAAEGLDHQASQPLALPDAIALAFQRQPRLRMYLEGIQQASGQSDIAFAPFLPAVTTGYSVGGFDLNVGGAPLKLGSSQGFTVLPPGFALPVGLNISTGYELAELKLQWLICDFGRRLGRYNQSLLGIDVHQLQTDRAYQTVANEVAVGYYNVLRTQALLRVARESVLRDQDELEVAEKLAKGGVIEREKVLRAEVKLAESNRLKDLSEEAVGVASAALNLAIGLQPDESIVVIEPTDLPAFSLSLPDCLQLAINQRREFQVAQRSIQIAQEGTRVAHADFAPRIVGGGSLFDLQQAAPRGFADIALGFIKLEWNVYEGGKRVAEQRIASSKVREAMAQAESIADTVAFQVNETYRRVITARRGIDRARPAVEQAQENYRLVRARAASGDATPSEITDAETALTRAQQNYLNSTYDYLSAFSKLDFAMGTAPTAANFAQYELAN
jgi:outer membrane protein TolC